MENTGSDGRKVLENQDKGGVSGVASLDTDSKLKADQLRVGTETTKFTGAAGAQDALNKEKPHVYTTYGADSVYVYCPEIGVPYMMIINKSASFANLTVSGLGVGGTNRDLNSATEVTQIKWAGGLDKNIANGIASGAIFALTLIRTATDVIYASVVEMDSAAI